MNLLRENAKFSSIALRAIESVLAHLIIAGSLHSLFMDAVLGDARLVSQRAHFHALPIDNFFKLWAAFKGTVAYFLQAFAEDNLL